MVKKFLIILFISLFVFISGLLVYNIFFAGNDPGHNVSGYFREQFPYVLSKPERKSFLPIELKEISGISYWKDNSIVAIEDEHGIIYMIDYQTGRITARYEFASDGDYEDITVEGKNVYVLRNSGKIFRVKNLGKEKQKDKKYEPDLDLAKNTEGLCYYQKLNVLLITYKSIKEKKNDGIIQVGTKPIFAFDLETRKILPEPVFILDFEKIRKISGMQITSYDFKPSGIAIHPISGYIYLISSIAKLLLVIDAEGNLVFLVPLDSAIFRQPEGICFLPDGSMLISSEGRGGNGYLLFFPYKL